MAETSGPSRSHRDALEWLAGAGDVEVVVPGPGAVAEAYAPFASVTVLDYQAIGVPAGALELARAARGFLREVRTFRRHIRRTRPDRVIVTTTALPAAIAAARTERVPLLVSAAEIVPREPGLGRRVGGTAVLRLTRSAADSIVGCSQVVTAQFDGARGRVATVYPPIAGDVADGDRRGFRERHAIDPAASCLAVIGSISRQRGQDVLLEALPSIREHVPGVRVLMVGDPHPRAADMAYRRELAELAGRLGVAEQVVWTGAVDRIADVYAAADAVVNPTRRESFGRVAAEALVARTPVVSTRVGGVPEVLRDGVDGLLVEPDAPAALAAAVVRVLVDRDLAARLVSAGAERVSREFSPERSLAGFADAVRVLASGASAARAAERDGAERERH